MVFAFYLKPGMPNSYDLTLPLDDEYEDPPLFRKNTGHDPPAPHKLTL